MKIYGGKKGKGKIAKKKKETEKQERQNNSKLIKASPPWNLPIKQIFPIEAFNPTKCSFHSYQEFSEAERNKKLIKRNTFEPYIPIERKLQMNMPIFSQPKPQFVPEKFKLEVNHKKMK
jgi:hypothetical protein